MPFNGYLCSVLQKTKVDDSEQAEVYEGGQQTGKKRVAHDKAEVKQ